MSIQQKIKEFYQSFLSSHFISNAVYIFAANLLAGAVGYAFWIFASYLFSAEIIGVSSSMISVVGFLSGFSSLGLGAGLVRYLSDVKNPKELINYALKVSIMVSMGLSVLYYLVMRVWNFSLLDSFNDLYFIICLLAAVSLLAIFNLFSQIFLSFRESKFTLQQTFLFNLVRLVLVFVLVGLGIYGIILSNIFAYLIAITLSFVVFVKQIFPQYREVNSQPIENKKEILIFSISNFLANNLYKIPTWLIPPLAFELWGGEDSAFVYIVWMIGALLISPGIALAGSAFAEGSHDSERFEKIWMRAAVYAMAITGVLSFLGLLFSEFIMSLFGFEYTLDAIELLRVIIIAAPIASVNNLFFSGLKVRKEKVWLVGSSALLALISISFPLLFASKGLISIGFGWVWANLCILGLFFIYYNKNKLGNIYGKIFS
ncbi:MAG: hypothetical protein ABFS17_00445 [Chloroflexota bacterium]